MGPEIQVKADAPGALSGPAVASGADGRVLVVWSRNDDAHPGLFGRLIDGATGAPLSAEIALSDGMTSYPKVVAEPGGGFLVGWQDALRGDFVRKCGADGRPLAPAAWASLVVGSAGTLDFARLASGDLASVVAWPGDSFPSFTYLTVQVFDGAGNLVRGEDTALAPGLLVNPKIAADPAGGFVVAWRDALGDRSHSHVWMWRFDALATPRTDVPILVADVAPGKTAPAIVFEDGGFAVVWRAQGRDADANGIFVQRFDAQGSRRGARIKLADSAALDLPPTLATGPQGRRLLLWSDRSATDGVAVLGRLFDVNWQPLSAPFQMNAKEPYDQQEAVGAYLPGGGFFAAWTSGPADGGTSGIVGRLFTADCLGGSKTLCLESDRFRVAVDWRDPRSGATGRGIALPLTGDAGAWWFFSAGNAELLVKVLDGRPVNGHWWVFFGAVTDLEVDLTVTDTLTGARQVYHKPPHTLASRADINAFAEPPSAPTPPTQSAPPLPAASASTAPCTAGVCLGDFQVSVEWTDPTTGEPHQATGVPLKEGSAYFWFFDPSNVEMIVKVLDGRSVNGHFWVFFSSLTDVEYTLRVDWPDQHLSRSYHNPRGHMKSHADTVAF